MLTWTVQFIHSFIHLFTHHLCTHSFIPTSFIHSFIHLFIHSHIIHSFTHLFIHSFTHLFMYLYIHTFIHSHTHSLTNSFFHWFVHSFNVNWSQLSNIGIMLMVSVAVSHSCRRLASYQQFHVVSLNSTLSSCKTTSAHARSPTGNTGLYLFCCNAPQQIIKICGWIQSLISVWSILMLFISVEMISGLDTVARVLRGIQKWSCSTLVTLWESTTCVPQFFLIFLTKVILMG